MMLPDIAVYVPAAFMKVRIPSSLKISRAAGVAGVATATKDSHGSAVPTTVPATGKTDKLRINSRRFILIHF
jgi:hypothetical protein